MTPKNKPKYQLIPEKVFQKLDSINDKLRLKIQGFSPDNLKEVVSTICTHIPKDANYSPLKMMYIKKIVPQGDKYLSGLIDIGIVQRSGFAVIGKSCFKYGFTAEYQSKFVSLPLNNAKLIRRIDKVHNELRKVATKSIRGHSEQAQYLKLLTVSPGYDAFIESHYEAETDQYNSIVASATRIINGDIFYSRDNTSGRFHSNVTNMAKSLRSFLRVNDEPLVNIDIKNSQPYLSTILLTNPSKVSFMTKNPAFALLLQSLKVSLCQDVKSYIDLVNSGQLYEYLMTEFSKEGLELTRNETKVQVLRILFARNRMPYDETNKKCRQIFKNRFPKVDRIFSKIRGSEKGDQFSNFKRFAILLQSIEAYLMLDVILKRIYKELPGTIAITIHDSILTGVLTNNVEAVRKIMSDELTFFVGFRPQIIIEGNMIGNKKENKRNKESNNNHYCAGTLVSVN